MSDEAKIDRILEHILELKEAMAELRGARLPERVSKLEDAQHEDRLRWAKVAGAATLGGGILHVIARKLGL